MAFTLNISGKAEVDDSIVQEFDAEFRVSLAEQGVMAQFTSLKRDIGAESISLPKYDQLALATTPLVEKEDVTSEAVSDDKVVLIPKEYGNVVTTTKLANLTTGGMLDRASAKLVGINAGRTQNKLAMLALDASANVLFGGDASSVATIEAGDDMTGALMGKVFNKLGRANVVGLVNGDYVMVAHDDVIHDLRENSTAGSWEDVSKYQMGDQVLKNLVGYYKGFRVVRDNLSTIVLGGVGSDIPTYNTYFMGYNALGEAVSFDTEMRATGPFDKLGRFINLGWYGVKEYKIVEPKAIWVTKTTSSTDNA